MAAKKSIGLLNIVFGADLRGFDKAMKKAQRSIKKFGSSLKRTGRSLTTNLTMPIVALGVVGVRAFDKQQKAIAQMEAGLKSTGGQVGITSKELQKMAADLQKTTLFGDEEILKDATAQLLTFTNIAGEQFKKTQKVVLDLATRLAGDGKGDLKSASIMLGKALNDPVANLSALSRAGIQFSTAQKETIKSLVETNRLADAQTIILAELEKQYGGSAAAAAAAGLGPIQQIGNALSDMSEAIGKVLIPMIKNLAQWIKKMAQKFDDLSDSQKENIVKWGLVVAAIGPMLMIIGQLSIGVSALIPLFVKLGTVMLANPYLAVAAAIGAIGLAAFRATSQYNEFGDVMGAVNDINKTAEKSILEQKIKVTDLTKVLKDENSTLEDKEKALNALNILAPKYYGKLSAAKIDVEKLDSATKDYIGTLRQEARAIAAKEKMIEIEKKILDEQQKLKNQLPEGLGGAITGAIERQLVGSVGWERTAKRIGDLKKQSQELSKVLKTFPTSDEAPTSGVIPTTTTTGPQFSPIEDQFKDIIKTDFLFNMSAAEDQFNDLSILTDYTFKTIEEQAAESTQKMIDSFKNVAVELGASLERGGESFTEFGEKIKSSMREAIKAIISLGVTEAITGALKNTMATGQWWMIPIVAGLASGMANTAFSSLIPAFNQGGLVSGPTLGLLGEGSGTSAMNPEIIAPLDKLKQYMGGGDMRVTGRLVGNDIFLSNEKTGVSRNRYI